MFARPTIPLSSRAGSTHSQQSEDQESARREIAAQVYRDVWDDFYRWKAENNEQSLRQLCVDSPDVIQHERDRVIMDKDGYDADWISDHDYPSSYSSSSLDPNEADHLDSELSFLSFRDSMSNRPKFRVTQYAHIPDDLLDESDNESEFEVDSYTLSIKPALSGTADYFHPHPRYISCTSTSRNLPDACQDNNPPFCPFEDDPIFDVPRFISQFPGFQWQIDFIDPDIEMVQLEAVRRLRYDLGFSFAQVDSLKIFLPLRKSDASGLLWDTSQRDLLRWPGMQLSELPELKVSDWGSVPPDDDLFAHLKVSFKGFCPNLNCVHSCCQIHREMKYPQLEPIKPLITSQGLRLKKGNPCGDYCFRYIDLSNDFQLEAVHWSDAADIKILEGMLQLAPDALPCDLAVIMHAKCQDVFVYRTRFFPDAVIEENPVFDPNDQHVRDVYNDEPSSMDQLEASAEFNPLPPCRHRGPCSRDSGCQCSLQGHHCQRNCWCDPKCAIRWKGCECEVEPGSRKKVCSTIECPCREAARECDPEVCRRCDARCRYPGKKQKLICHNADSQRAQYPLVQVKRAIWGLGAFTTQKLRPGQPIGEYTGEILTTEDEIHNRTTPIVNHTGLNYKFDLNKCVILDSMYAGNEMRYLNHEGPTQAEEFSAERTKKTYRVKANCRGKVVYVNNDHRIVFYADRPIEAGAELFIDYGAAYWTAKDEWATGEQGKIYWR